MTEPHFNGLTAAEAERLAMLAEEAGEIVQIVGKILRHGYESCHPDGGPNNGEELSRELTDFLSVMRAMVAEDEVSEGVLMPTLLTKAWNRKLRYAHHQ